MEDTCSDAARSYLGERHSEIDAPPPSSLASTAVSKKAIRQRASR